MPKIKAVYSPVPESLPKKEKAHKLQKIRCLGASGVRDAGLGIYLKTVEIIVLRGKIS